MNADLQNYDIVMMALPRWDGQYSSTAYSLAQALSQHVRVFYIDNPFTIKDFVVSRNSDQIQRRRQALLGRGGEFVNPIAGNRNLVVATPEMTFPINWLPAGPVYDFMSTQNDRIVFRLLRKMKSVFGIRNFIFINSFNPLFARTLPADLGPLLTIYHCVDDISKSEYIAKHGTRLEKKAVGDADFTLVTSKELQRLKSVDSPHVYYLPNAANVEIFQRAFVTPTARPPELADLPPGRKIILYMGNICQRIDYELLVKLANAHSDKTLVMVGPKSNENYRKSGLDRLPNVLFTGSKKLDELPAFVASSDCCLIPFLKIPLTKSIYPLKINEYLSGGKPVVTTDFSEDIINFEGIAYVADTHESFIRSVGEAVSTDTPEKQKERVDYAAGNNWESRASRLLEIIDENLKRYDRRRKQE